MKPNFEEQRAHAYELYLQGKKYQEIADAVGVTLSAVKSWACLLYTSLVLAVDNFGDDKDDEDAD